MGLKINKLYNCLIFKLIVFQKDLVSSTVFPIFKYKVKKYISYEK